MLGNRQCQSIPTWGLVTTQPAFRRVKTVMIFLKKQREREREKLKMVAYLAFWTDVEHMV